MNWTLILSGALSGILAAIPVDLDAFIKVRSEKPEAKFDWTLACFRWLQGAVIGAGSGLATGAMVGSHV